MGFFAFSSWTVPIWGLPPWRPAPCKDWERTTDTGSVGRNSSYTTDGLVVDSMGVASALGFEDGNMVFLATYSPNGERIRLTSWEWPWLPERGFLFPVGNGLHGAYIWGGGKSKLVRFGESGDTLWTKSTDDTAFSEATPTRDHGIFRSGIGKFQRLDSNGAVEWERQVPHRYAWGLTERLDGSFLYLDGLALMAIDSSRNPELIKEFSATPDSSQPWLADPPEWVKPLRHGGYRVKFGDRVSDYSEHWVLIREFKAEPYQPRVQVRWVTDIPGSDSVVISSGSLGFMLRDSSGKIIRLGGADFALYNNGSPDSRLNVSAMASTKDGSFWVAGARNVEKEPTRYGYTFRSLAWLAKINLNSLLPYPGRWYDTLPVQTGKPFLHALFPHPVNPGDSLIFEPDWPDEVTVHIDSLTGTMEGTVEDSHSFQIKVKRASDSTNCSYSLVRFLMAEGGGTSIGSDYGMRGSKIRTTFTTEGMLRVELPAGISWDNYSTASLSDVAGRALGVQVASVSPGRNGTRILILNCHGQVGSAEILVLRLMGKSLSRTLLLAPR